MLWAGNDLEKIGYSGIRGCLVDRHMVAKGVALSQFPILRVA